MKVSRTGLIAVALFSSINLSFASVNKSDATAKTTSQAGMAAKGDQGKKTEAATKMKVVDINSASKAELKTPPGIGDANRDGRPLFA